MSYLEGERQTAHNNNIYNLKKCYNKTQKETKMIIDTHAHLNFSAFKKDANEVIERALKNNIWMINVGSKYDTSKRAIDMARKYEKGVYASVGLHPLHLEETKIDEPETEGGTPFKSHAEEFDYKKYKTLAVSSDKVVAIGEVGLDYWHKPKNKQKKAEFKEKQKSVFSRQLDLAAELMLPVIIHCRVAFDDLLEILGERRDTELKGVIHCFTGSWIQAQKFLEMGFYLGFNGIIFNRDLDEVILKTPTERILMETDSPYLSPIRSNRRNEPLFIKYIIEKISQIKKITPVKLANMTTDNAKQLFKI